MGIEALVSKEELLETIYSIVPVRYAISVEVAGSFCSEHGRQSPKLRELQEKRANERKSVDNELTDYSRDTEEIRYLIQSIRSIQKDRVVYTI